jgi:CTP-dependent riboflavin kinase
MSFRMFSVATSALAMLVGASALAAKVAEQGTHDGKVVSITGSKLVMMNKEGQEHSHTLTADAKLTLDGKVCKAADLKPGTRIRVTTQGADKGQANRIEGLDKNLDFASDRHDGKVVSITGNKLVMTSLEGEEHSHALTVDAKLTLDGKVCKAADLKPGTRIRVTTQGADKSVANRIEGLDKNLDFASL